MHLPVGLVVTDATVLGSNMEHADDCAMMAAMERLTHA